MLRIPLRACTRLNRVSQFGLQCGLRSIPKAFVSNLVYDKQPQEIVTPEGYEIPDYMKEIYDIWYVRPNRVKLLDRQIVVQTILFGYFGTLCRMLIDELVPGNNVLQLGSTYGKLTPEVAKFLGPKGEYHVEDILPIQVASCNRKMSQYPVKGGCILNDAANDPGDQENMFDAVTSYMLFHEITDDRKTKVINRMMKSVKPGGKVICIEYHMPYKWSPLRPWMKFIWWWLEPLAFGCLNRELYEMGDPELAKQFTWRKELRCMGLYQKLVGIKKI